MTAPTHGYALMRTATVLAEAYDSSPLRQARLAYSVDLRRILSHVRPASYHGIGRYPINADYNYDDPGWQWAKRERVAREELARLAVAETLGVEGVGVPDEAWLIDGPWLLPDIDRAVHVRSFLERPAEYELIEVALYPARTKAPPLGFDVGYWASGNFSIVCDTAVWPIWHSPPIEALGDLRHFLGLLNDAVLFPNAESAGHFRDVYRAQPWAEKEGSAFQILEVAAAGLVAA